MEKNKSKQMSNKENNNSPISINMEPKERKAAFDAVEEPKPTWETFKRMMGHADNDVDKVIKKWRKRSVAGNPALRDDTITFTL